MPSRIDIGPETGPFVELDEENGEFVIRVPEDEVNFDQSDLRNVKDFTAGSVNTEVTNTTDEYQYDGNPLAGWHKVEEAEDNDSNSLIDVELDNIPSGEWMFHIEFEYENFTSAEDPLDVNLRVSERQEGRHSYLFNNFDGTWTSDSGDESILLEAGRDPNDTPPELWVHGKIDANRGPYYRVVSGVPSNYAHNEGFGIMHSMSYRRNSKEDLFRVFAEQVEGTCTIERFARQ